MANLINVNTDILETTKWGDGLDQRMEELKSNPLFQKAVDQRVEEVIKERDCVCGGKKVKKTTAAKAQKILSEEKVAAASA